MHGAGPASRPAGDQNDRSAAGPAGDGLASSTCFARCPRLRGEYLPTPLPLRVRIPLETERTGSIRRCGNVLAEGEGLEPPRVARSRPVGRLAPQGALPPDCSRGSDLGRWRKVRRSLPPTAWGVPPHTPALVGPSPKDGFGLVAIS